MRPQLWGRFQLTVHTVYLRSSSQKGHRALSALFHSTGWSAASCCIRGGMGTSRQAGRQASKPLLSKAWEGRGAGLGAGCDQVTSAGSVSVPGTVSHVPSTPAPSRVPTLFCPLSPSQKRPRLVLQLPMERSEGKWTVTEVGEIQIPSQGHSEGQVWKGFGGAGCTIFPGHLS